MMRLPLLALFVGLCLSCQKETARPLIGVLLPESGVAADDGKLAIQGYNFFLKELGDRAPCDFALLDNATDRAVSIQKFNELVAMGASIVVGPAYSGPSLAAGTAAAEQRVPMISPCATHMEVTRGNSFSFRACFVNEDQAESLARFGIEELGRKRVSILCDLLESYSFDLAEIFEREITSRGGELLGRHYFRSGQTDFSEIVAAITKEDPELVFVPAYASEVIPLLSAAFPAWDDVIVLGTDGWDTPSLTAATNIDSSCRAYLSNHFALGEDQLVNDFVKRFSEAYPDQEVGQLTALTYDAMRLAVEALLTSEDANNAVLVRDALANLRDVRGVTGVFDMNESGNPAKSLVIQRLDCSGVTPKLVFERRE